MVGETAQHRIQVIIENIIKGQEKVNAMTTDYRRMGNQFTNVSKSMVSQALKQQQAVTVLAKKNRFLAEWSQKLGINTSRVRDTMSAAGLKINDSGVAVDLAGRKVKNLYRVMKTAELQTRRFNMSLLSVMFAGMALQRSMGRLIRPAAEAAGIFDIFGGVLEDVFSPIMEALEPAISAIGDVLSNMSDNAKLVVGAFVLFLFVGGVALALIGQMGLAIGGLSILFGKTVLTATAASGAVFKLGVASAVSGTTAQVAFLPFLPILYAIVAVVGLAIAIFYYWDDIMSFLGDDFKRFGKIALAIFFPMIFVLFKLGDILKWLGSTVRMFVTSTALFFGWLGDKISTFGETVSGTFTSIWDWIIEIWESLGDWLSEKWDAIKEYFIEKWTAVKEWFKKLWKSLSDWFWNILSKIGNFFKNVWNWISTTFWNVLTKIGTFLKNTWNSLSIWFLNILTKIGTFFREKWESLKEWFGEKLNSIYEFFKNIWNTLSNWFSDKLNKIATFFSDTWNSIKETARSVWEGIKDVIKGAINGIIELINKLIRAWNKLSFKVPTINIPFLGTFGGQSINVPTISEISPLAKGGIVRKPTLAMIGERGPEAVVPLDKHKGSTINFSPTFNVTVADKSEFERMIKFNNTKMVEDLRRMVKD